jgi:HPt (histidine-containing phosphotransfer) domain-containing protein
MLQMLLDFLPEVRNKIEEQLVGENPEGLVDMIHKLHGSCGYSGVPRMKNLCQLIEQQLRSGTKEEELEPEFLELLDEMDNVAREAEVVGVIFAGRRRDRLIQPTTQRNCCPALSVAATFRAVIRTLSLAFFSASSRYRWYR